MGPRITTVIMDLTGTMFCDSADLREMITAYRLAEASGIDLRLVVPGSLMRLFTMTGVDRRLSLHPTFSAALHAWLSGALGGDERQHVTRPDFLRWLAHHGEEHLQVIGGSQHRVRPASPGQELQVHIS